MKPTEIPTEDQARSLALEFLRSYYHEGLRIPPARSVQELRGTNAELPIFSPERGSVRYSRNPLPGAMAWTYAEGPLIGKIVVEPNPRLPYSNLLSHEGFHQRALRHGLAPYPPELEYAARNLLTHRMSKLQDNNTDDLRYWGKSPSYNVNEQLASIKGYEGSLPKGTSLSDTDVGKFLFGSSPGVKDYYFTRTSHPFGGLWEGQTPAPSPLKQLLRSLHEYANRQGFKFKTPNTDPTQ